MNPGSIVSCRNREWVLLPSDDDSVYLLRPLTGAVDDVVALHKQLTNLIGGVLPHERVGPASFPLPTVADISDAGSAHLLWQAARLTLREGATPFRSLGRISIRPRVYQFVPLLMALRLDRVRLFIADDVGVGKTIEALLVAKEMLERGEIRRVCVLAPPALCDQWQVEMSQKMNLEPVVIRSGTVRQLERQKAGTESIYRYYPVQIASIDFVKTDRHRHLFLQDCPELVIVDEVHGAAAAGTTESQQHRHALVKAVVARQEHLILLTATPHSGVDTAFRSLTGLLDPTFADWDMGSLDEAQRTTLAHHFVQRTRRDIEKDCEAEHCFPTREHESLLESHAVIEDHGGRRTFALIAGSERKETGSYYTPPELVNELVISALDPVIAERLKAPPAAHEKALLSIRVCDPACGSGHFLLAAARRIGRALARVRSGDEEPSPEASREATRDVIAHCIDGVDRNPLAVDLCRVALWLESHTGNRPLTVLDHRIRWGDLLVGVFSLDALKEGIPDEAFAPFEDDDRDVAREAKRRNRSERRGFRDLQEEHPIALPSGFGAASRELDAIPDDSAEAIRRKKRLFESAHAETNWRHWETACNLWTAAFFQPLHANERVTTSAALAEHLSGRAIDSRLSSRALVIATGQRFFHWPLEFPEVFADGGFDVVLSNPPWERVKLQEQEFFAARDTRIASAPNKASRAALIRRLPNENPALSAEYQRALRAANGVSGFARNSNRFPLAGRGDINTFAVFAELDGSSPVVDSVASFCHRALHSPIPRRCSSKTQ